MPYTTALVTGGSGFIGSHLVDALIARGVAVTVIDWEDPTADRRNAQATYVRCDIRSADVAAAIASAAPEVLFHLAAHIDDRASVLDPVMNAEHNEIGSIRVFAAARAAGARSMIFASSCAAYGLPDAVPVAETAPARPRTPYGISKLAGETYLNAYTMADGAHTVALRFANVYGPRQYGNKESGAIAIFTEKLLRGEQPFLNHDGTTTRDYVFVQDVVRALIAASESSHSGVYNVGTGREVATKDLFAMVVKEIGTDLQPIPRPEVADALTRICLDTAAIVRDMDWRAEVALEDGIRETIAWYREHVM